MPNGSLTCAADLAARGRALLQQELHHQFFDFFRVRPAWREALGNPGSKDSLLRGPVSKERVDPVKEFGQLGMTPDHFGGHGAAAADDSTATRVDVLRFSSGIARVMIGSSRIELLDRLIAGRAAAEFAQEFRGIHLAGTGHDAIL